MQERYDDADRAHDDADRADMERQIADLKAELEAAKMENNESQRLIEALTNEEKRQKERAIKAEKILRIKHGTLDTSVDLLIQYHDQIATLTAENERLKDAHGCVSRFAAQLEDERQALNASLAEAESSNKALFDDLQTNERRRDELIAQLAEVTEQRNVANEAAAYMRDRLADSQILRDALTAKVSSLEAERDRLKSISRVTELERLLWECHIATGSESHTEENLIHDVPWALDAVKELRKDHDAALKDVTALEQHNAALVDAVKAAAHLIGEVRFIDADLDAAEETLAQLKAALNWKDQCLCGSVEARQRGDTAWVRMDIVCPVCDGKE